LPSGISVINQQPEQVDDIHVFRKQCLSDNIFAEKLTPMDIKLSSAMAVSAAAVSPYLGAHRNWERYFTHIFSVLGLEMAAFIVYDMNSEKRETFWKKVGFRY
jgi:hypothetical protein